MSRDAFSYDPQDAGETRDTVHAPLRPSAEIHVSRRARQQESGAGGPWPRR